MKGLPRNPDRVNIDGDLLVFAVAAAYEYSAIEIADVDVSEIIRTTEKKIQNIKHTLGASKVVVYFSHSRENFRYIINKMYKSSRKDTWETSDGNLFLKEADAKIYQEALEVEFELKFSPKAWKPYNLKNVFAYIKATYETVCVEGLEADDMLKVDQKPDGSTCIATIDKDLLQSMGSHYRWETPHSGEKGFFVEGNGKLWLTIRGDFDNNAKHQKSLANARNKNPTIIPVQADIKSPKKEVKGYGPMWFLYQCLIGDPTDSIQGCGKRIAVVVKSGVRAGEKNFKREGIGSIEAYTALEYCKSYREGVKIVANLYLEVFLTKDVAKQQLIDNGRQVFMVKEVREFRGETFALMWHPSPKVKEWFNLTSNYLCGGTYNLLLNMTDKEQRPPWNE
jgi:5'-3' exonuclease